MTNGLTLLLTFICVTIAMPICDSTCDTISSSISAAEPPHPYHVSMAEVNWNPKSQKFEVALCLWPADLEKALAQQTGRPIDLAKEPDVDRLMETYISKRFSIHSTTPTAEQAASPDSGLSGDRKNTNVRKNSVTAMQSESLPKSAAIGTIAVTVIDDIAPKKIKWYGHETNAKKAWLYFEIAGTTGNDWSIENRVFFELNDDQLNHVQWSGAGKTETLVCNAENPKISLPKK